MLNFYKLQSYEEVLWEEMCTNCSSGTATGARRTAKAPSTQSTAVHSPASCTSCTGTPPSTAASPRLLDNLTGSPY